MKDLKKLFNNPSVISLIILLFCSICIKKVYSQSNIIASDLTWTCIGKDSFIVKLVLYRDCNGAKFQKSMVLNVEDALTGQKITDLVISLPPSVDITPTCKASCTRCMDSMCSFPYGIEQYSCAKLLVLDKSVSSCEIRFSYSSCCRSNAITTGPANTKYYTEALLNRCISPCDNSPTFTNPPVAMICRERDFVFCHGIIDNDVDSNGALIDSLSYDFTSPLTAKGTNVAYLAPYSYDKPIKFWGFPDANISLPRGFHIDKNVGQILFRAMENEFTVFGIKISGWRKINGIMTKISENSREMAIIVIECPLNNAPILSGPFYKEVCAGEVVSFSISSNDYDTKDTVLISWNGGIPGANWVTTNKKEKHPTGILTWQTKESDARDLPYTFTASVKDDACPVNASSTRAYQIYVKSRPKAYQYYVDSGNWNYYFNAVIISGKNPTYTWIGDFPYGFYKTGQQVSHHFDKKGTYPYHLEVVSRGCKSIYYDTIRIIYPMALEEKNNVVMVFPNPVSDKLYIESEDGLEQIELIDLEGRTILKKYYIGNVTTEVDVSEIKHQEYILKIINRRGTFTYKVILN